MELILPIQLVFIDFEKVFDCAGRDQIWNAIRYSFLSSMTTVTRWAGSSAIQWIKQGRRKITTNKTKVLGITSHRTLPSGINDQNIGGVVSAVGGAEVDVIRPITSVRLTFGDLYKS